VLKFKNISGGDVEAIRTERRPVDADEVIEVPGRLVTSRPKPKDGEPEPGPIPDDAYLVDNNGEERAWPHATWELVNDSASKPAAKPDKEN
jgi:hypothetical protein